MSETLYQLTQAELTLIDVMEQLDGSEGQADVVEAIEEQIGYIREDIEGKVEKLGKIIQELNGKAIVREAEAERLRQAAQVSKRAASRLKDYLFFCMKDLGCKKVETALFKATVSKNGGKAPLQVDEEFLPNTFFNTVLTPNMDSIREALKQGETIPGVTEVPRGDHLRLK